MERRIAFLPGEVLAISCGNELWSNNPYSHVWMNVKKSAEVIVPEVVDDLWEGPHNNTKG